MVGAGGGCVVMGVEGREVDWSPISAVPEDLGAAALMPVAQRAKRNSQVAGRGLRLVVGLRSDIHGIIRTAMRQGGRCRLRIARVY
jgi:hypothetical protein